MTGVPRNRRSRAEKDAIKERRTESAAARRTFTETQGRLIPDPEGPIVVPLRRCPDCGSTRIISSPQPGDKECMDCGLVGFMSDFKARS